MQTFLKPLSSNPKTLKRQPTGAFKPVSAIGAHRQSMAVDKIANLAIPMGLVGGLTGATTNFKPRKNHKLSDTALGTGMSSGQRAVQGVVGAGLGVGAGAIAQKIFKLAELEKEALKFPGRKGLATLGLAAALHAPQQAKAQGGWLAKKVLSPLVESMQGSYKMPALDTTRAATSPMHWVTKEHPTAKHFGDQVRDAVGDSTLQFKGFNVDTTRVGNKLNINAHGVSSSGDFTHRLHRTDFVPKPGQGHLSNREQWVDTISDSDTKRYVAQRQKSWLNRARGSLAQK